MTIFFLQKLNPPILPVLHEVINSKKLNNASRSTKTSISQQPISLELLTPSQDNKKFNAFFDNSDSNGESDEDDEDETIVFLPN